MMRRLRWDVCLLSIWVALAFACTGRGHGEPPLPPDVHVAGYVSNGTKNVAMYWKNGKGTPLTDGTRDARAFGVTVSNGDVYVAGGQSNANGVGVATIWKNGKEILLTDGTKQAIAEAVTVVGNDVYAAGYETDGTVGYDTVTYWKNGVAVPLNTKLTTGEARAIAVSGNDVYVAGWTMEELELSPNNYLLCPVAKLWKNGVETWLSDGITMNSVAESLVVSGGDVYVSGYGAMSGQGSAPYIAHYWKNGKAVPLTDGIHGAKAFSIALNGSDVYAAGFSSADAGIMATVWKNGTPAKWTSGNTTALILSMAVSGNSVYAVGSDGGTVKCWMNGTATDLTDGSQEAEADAICLSPR